MTEFKAGDKVYHATYGWLVYDGIGGGGIHIIDVDNQSFIISYADKELLSFTEYTLEGFSQERPEEVIERHTVVYHYHSDYGWRTAYYSHRSKHSHHIYAGQEKGDSNSDTMPVYELSLTNPLL